MTTFVTKSLSRTLIAGATASLVALSAASPALAQDGRWGGDRDHGDYQNGGYQNGGYHNGGYQNGGNPRDAVRQCTAAAERAASRQGRADVTQIRNVDRNGRGYTVRGRLEVNQRGWNDHNNNRWGRDDWRRNATGSFDCRVERGRVVHLDIHGIRGL